MCQIVRVAIYSRSSWRQHFIYHACMEQIVLMKVAAQSLQHLESVWAECTKQSWAISLFPTALRCVLPPLAPVHGRRNVTGLTIGSTVTYSCSTGYTLNGSSTVTCMANRQWSGQGPYCSRKPLFHRMYVYQAFGCVHVVQQYIVVPI